MTGMTMVDSYAVVPDSLQPSMTTEWRLEQDMTTSFPDPFEIDKLQELQMLDGEIDNDKEWNILEISAHRTARTVRRVPGQYDDKFLVRQNMYASRYISITGKPNGPKWML
jgi:hypothetical protein